MSRKWPVQSTKQTMKLEFAKILNHVRKKYIKIQVAGKNQKTPFFFPLSFLIDKMKEHILLNCYNNRTKLLVYKCEAKATALLLWAVNDDAQNNCRQPAFV